MKRLFKASRVPPDDVPVLSTADLKRNRAYDNYRNNKKVADPMFDFIALAVKLLPFLCIFAAGFLIFYYLWSPHKNLQTLAGICTNILVYVAGIVTAAMNEAQKRKDD
jgi:hypothetical protein